MTKKGKNPEISGDQSIYNKLINSDPQLKALRELLSAETDQLRKIEIEHLIRKRIVELHHPNIADTEN